MKHTAYVVKSWLLYNVPLQNNCFLMHVAKQLLSPPQSPDFNPIEYMWDYLDRQFRKHRITNVNMLKNILLEEWNKILSSYTEKLVSLMNRRLKACVNAKGCSTKFFNFSYSCFFYKFGLVYKNFCDILKIQKLNFSFTNKYFYLVNYFLFLVRFILLLLLYKIIFLHLKWYLLNVFLKL